MSDTWREWEGNIVDGQFQLRRHLGGSDHSVVFLTERGEDAKAAIKFIQADAVGANVQLARWKLVAQLSHPNLIKLFETGRCHLAGMDLLYVVMEYAEENLAQFLPQRSLSPAETRDMLEPFLETLTYLHGKGFVHGHIKPGNILAIDDQLKLSSDTLSRTGDSRAAVEKPDVYTPPEAASEKISPSADVWSLGITLVEALTQRALAPDELALQGLGPEELAYQGAATPRASQQEEAPPATLPEPFLDIARHCLHRDPLRRWTIAEIAARLNPPPTPPPAPRVTAPAVAEPKVLASIAAAPTPAPAKPVAAPAKPSQSVDPLAVPLSSVDPPSASQRHTVQNQATAKRYKQQQTIPMIGAPAKSYYIAVGLALALIVSAALAIPRLRSHRPDAAQTSEVTATAPSSAVTSSPATIEPPAAAKSPAKTHQKPGTAAADEPAKKSARQSAQRPAQDSLQTTSEKQSIRRDPSPSVPASSPASARSEAVSSAPAPASHALSGPATLSEGAKALGGPVARGEVLNQVLPEISQKSRSTIHGTVKVVVKVAVDASGAVSAAEFSSRGPSRFFADAALDAARRWDFAPAKIDGHAVPSEWLLQFAFTQSGTNVTPQPTKP